MVIGDGPRFCTAAAALESYPDHAAVSGLCYSYCCASALNYSAGINTRRATYLALSLLVQVHIPDAARMYNNTNYLYLQQ